MGIIRIDLDIPVVLVAKVAVCFAGSHTDTGFARCHGSVHRYCGAAVRFISVDPHAHTVAVFSGFNRTAVYDKGSPVCIGRDPAGSRRHAADVDRQGSAGSVYTSVFHIPVVIPGIRIHDDPVIGGSDISRINRHLAAGMPRGRRDTVSTPVFCYCYIPDVYFDGGIVPFSVQPDVLGIACAVYIAAVDLDRRARERVYKDGVCVGRCDRAGIFDRFICADIDGHVSVHIIVDIYRLVAGCQGSPDGYVCLALRLAGIKPPEHKVQSISVFGGYAAGDIHFYG